MTNTDWLKQQNLSLSPKQAEKFNAEVSIEYAYSLNVGKPADVEVLRQQILKGVLQWKSTP